MYINDRHPETSSRPTFVKLVSDLSQVDIELLSSPLSNEDKTCSPESPVLGGLLDTGHKLYIELENVSVRYLFLILKIYTNIISIYFLLLK